jgi:threonine/homoserine/homoserine lactone efflux protein
MLTKRSIRSSNAALGRFVLSTHVSSITMYSHSWSGSAQGPLDSVQVFWVREVLVADSVQQQADVHVLERRAGHLHPSFVGAAPTGPVKPAANVLPRTAYDLSMLWAFVPIAALVTITPGPATATVVRSAMRGRRPAFVTVLGNGTGVLTWALLSALGISALVAASEAAFVVLKLVGGATLVYLGARSLLGGGDELPAPRRGTAFRDGLATGLANPKLAVFFVAVFPQFVRQGSPVLPAALGMAALILLFDLVWFSILALVVDRTRRAVVGSALARRLERLVGAGLVGLGVRVALEQR